MWLEEEREEFGVRDVEPRNRKGGLVGDGTKVKGG